MGVKVKIIQQTQKNRLYYVYSRIILTTISYHRLLLARFTPKTLVAVNTEHSWH